MIENTEINYPNIRQSWGIVGIVILAMIVFSPVIFFLNNRIGDELSFLVYYMITMGISLWIADVIRRKKTGVSIYNFDFGSAKIIALVCIAVISLQIGITSPIVSLIPVPEFLNEMLIEMANRTGVYSFIAIVIAAPIFEELIFRGIILDGLLKKYTPLKSILLSSFLFGLIHLNPWQFIGAFIIGIFSGWIYYKTKKLTLPILMHMANNLFAFVGMYFTDAETMMNQSLTEQYGGLLNLILITVGGIVVAIICIRILRNDFNKAEIIVWQIKSPTQPEE